MGNPCLRCGACCAHYRVSFYWSEADPSLAGTVPAALAEPLNPYRLAMRGTLCPPLRCVALDGQIGETVCCGIYEKRPSPCRELEPWQEDGQPDDKCTRARAAHNLPPLSPCQGKPVRATEAPPGPKSV